MAVPARQESEAVYKPIQDVSQVAKHLTALREMPKDALSNTDCLQAIADVATLYGTTEDNGSGWVFAYLQIKGNQYLHASFNAHNQTGGVTIERKVRERGRKTYAISDSWSFMSQFDEGGDRIFYINNYKQGVPNEEITPADRARVIHDLSRAFVLRARAK
jgi:hypothetical protein